MVPGRLVFGRLVPGRLVSGRLVFGRLVSGKLVFGRVRGKTPLQLPIYQFTNLPIYQSTNQPIYQSTNPQPHQLFGRRLRRDFRPGSRARLSPLPDSLERYPAPTRLHRRLFLNSFFLYHNRHNLSTCPHPTARFSFWANRPARRVGFAGLCCPKQPARKLKCTPHLTFPICRL